MAMNARFRTSSKNTKKKNNIKDHLKHLKVLQPHVKYEKKK